MREVRSGRGNGILVSTRENAATTTRTIAATTAIAAVAIAATVAIYTPNSHPCTLSKGLKSKEQAANEFNEFNGPNLAQACNSQSSQTMIIRYNSKEPASFEHLLPDPTRWSGRPKQDPYVKGKISLHRNSKVHDLDLERSTSASLTRNNQEVCHQSCILIPDEAPFSQQS